MAINVAAVDIVVEQLQRYCRDIQRYLYLRMLQRTNEPLFLAVLLQRTHFVLPYIYTPTVGEACARYFNLPLQPYGLWLTPADAGCMLERLRALPQQEVAIVVVTDGERILGLGDLGAGGLGICEGKSLLYTAAAGVHPRKLLPLCLDVGTNNQALLADPAYRGLRSRRLTGAPYWALVDELMAALRAWRPHLVVQFEDFGNTTAFQLLSAYRGRTCAFNDDIQGTACITLAGLLAALRAANTPLPDARFLFYGAGEAGTGIGELVALQLHKRHGLPLKQARRCCVFMDSKGLVHAGRSDLQHHKRPFAHKLPPAADLLDAVQQLQPHALIGVSTMASAFSPAVLRAMAAAHERPIVFPLSNPTSKSECTFQEAMRETGGRVLFASGSPFPPIKQGGTVRHPSQANNAYVFPAIGHAAVLTCSRVITDDVFLLVAERLAGMVGDQELAKGKLFPSFDAIGSVSARLVAAAAWQMVSEGSGTVPTDFEVAVGASAAAVGADTGERRWEAYARSKMVHFAKSARL